MQRIIFDTEHNMFRDAFAAFLKKEVVPHQDEWEAAGVVSREVWKKAGDMGFLLPWADEEYGGSGLKDFRYEQIMCEELAKIHEPGFMLPLHSALCGPYIAEYGNAEQKARFMPGIISGDLILAVAMTEPSAGSDLAGMRTHRGGSGRSLRAQWFQGVYLQWLTGRCGDCCGQNRPSE